MAMMVILLLFLTYAHSFNHQECGCLNGGICAKQNFYTPCECPPLQVGKYCQSKASRIQNSLQDNIAYLDLDFHFKYFVFLPRVGNYFKFTFNVCGISNPQDFQSLIFMTSDQEDGSPNYQPPIVSAAKIKVKQGSCLTFSSPYIEINRQVPQAFRRIIIGVRTLQISLKSYFYRTVTGKFLHNVPQYLLDNQPQNSEVRNQRLYFNVTYEHYRQSFTQTAIRKLIRVLVGIGILLATFLFCRIALFSYGIDTKRFFLWVYKVKHFCNKLCPFRTELRNYQNYLKFKAKAEDEQQLKNLNGKDECVICIQPFVMQDIIQQTVCRHIYHQSCLEEWQLKNEICPLCRHKLVKVETGWITQIARGR